VDERKIGLFYVKGQVRTSKLVSACELGVLYLLFTRLIKRKEIFDA
jgi:hypothetical protein